MVKASSWGIGAAAIAVVVAVVGWQLWRQSQPPPCETVRAMLEYNSEHSAAIGDQVDSPAGQQAPLADYERWAHRMHEYADAISDPELAPHVQRLAKLSDRTVGIVGEAREETRESPHTATPRWVETYVEIDGEFRREVSTLEAKCPA
jgi:hypothetical protein